MGCTLLHGHFTVVTDWSTGCTLLHDYFKYPTDQFLSFLLLHFHNTRLTTISTDQAERHIVFGLDYYEYNLIFAVKNNQSLSVPAYWSSAKTRNFRLQGETIQEFLAQFLLYFLAMPLPYDF